MHVRAPTDTEEDHVTFAVLFVPSRKKSLVPRTRGWLSRARVNPSAEAEGKIAKLASRAEISVIRDHARTTARRTWENGFTVKPDEFSESGEESACGEVARSKGEERGWKRLPFAVVGGSKGSGGTG